MRGRDALKNAAKKTWFRWIFRLVMVYIFVLGALNIAFTVLRPQIERAVKDALDAEYVSLGHISNFPFIFASIGHIHIIVNDEISLNVKGIYFRYRLWSLFTGDFDQFVASFVVDTLDFQLHNKAFEEYLEHLRQRYNKNKTKENFATPPHKKLNFDIKKMYFRLRVNQLGLTVRMLQQFRHFVDANEVNILFERNVVNWEADLGVRSVWSNQVHLATLAFNAKGQLSNFNAPQGGLDVALHSLNAGGIPIITDTVGLAFKINGRDVLFDTISQSSNSSGFVLEGSQDQFELAISRSFRINYADYEEYEMLDYAFKPGIWNFGLTVKKNDDWYTAVKFWSEQHPNYGLDLEILPLGSNKYHALVNLNTHFFGGILGDLLLENRHGLLPLPTGTLQLDNVRFILPGLVFSADAKTVALAGQNVLDITAFNVRMNNGLIGNTKARFHIDGSKLKIEPLRFSNDVDVYVDLEEHVNVYLKAYSVNGDFLKENTKLAIFGLDKSIYKGEVFIDKKDRYSDPEVHGQMTGFLDGERQIDVSLTFKDNKIDVPRLYFVSQNLLLNGAVNIKSDRTNTYIDISAAGEFGRKGKIPISVDVLVNKYRTTVSGLADGQVPIVSDTAGDLTTLILDFKKYPLHKLGVTGSASGILEFNFTPQGWEKFAFHSGSWEWGGRSVVLDFDAEGTNGILNFKRFNLGLDTEILKGYGYFKIAENGGLGAAVRFERGGSLQFITGSYTFKARVDVRKFLIEDLLTIPGLQSLAGLQNRDTELIWADLNLDIGGVWNNPDFSGSVNLESAQETEAFQFVVQNFSKEGNFLSVTNLRLRHAVLNLDSDISFRKETQGFNLDVVGALAVGNVIKTELKMAYQKNEANSILVYKIPNLYFLSRAPIEVSGKVLEHNNQYIFISDHHKYGLSGVLSLNAGQTFWNASFLTDAVKLQSEGREANNTIAAVFDGSMQLDKLKLSGDIQRLKGNAGFHILTRGSSENPIFDGNLSFSNIEMQLRSLRNRVLIPNNHKILIESNKVLFPRIPIVSRNTGQFVLDGFFDIRDKAIENIDLKFFADPLAENNSGMLVWKLNVPFITFNGRTIIDHISISGPANELLLSSRLTTENVNMRLELGDVLSEGSPNDIQFSPFAELLESLNIDIDFTLGKGTRFLNQLFDLYFEPDKLIKIQGNVGDNTVAVQGDMDIIRGTINYLNKELKIDKGNLAFSGEPGDVFPMLRVSAMSSERDAQNNQIDIYVDFDGKLPNLELANISSVPSRSRSELFGLLGLGSVQARDAASVRVNDSGNIVASGVGVAENAFFTSPLSRRIRQVVPIDNLQVKTDVLGNLTRSFALGQPATGISVFHGSELELGQYLPSISGLQLKYNLRFESPENSSLDTSQILNQIHKIGLGWDYPVRNVGQFGLGVNAAVNAKQEGTETEAIFEGSFRRRF